MHNNQVFGQTSVPNMTGACVAYFRPESYDFNRKKNRTGKRETNKIDFHTTISNTVEAIFAANLSVAALVLDMVSARTWHVSPALFAPLLDFTVIIFHL